MKRQWLEIADIMGDVACINLDHVDYIRTDFVLKKTKIKFTGEEHECDFDYMNKEVLAEALDTRGIR